MACLYSYLPADMMVMMNWLASLHICRQQYKFIPIIHLPISPEEYHQHSLQHITSHTYHITTQCIVSNRIALTFTSITAYRRFICIVGTHFIFILTRYNIYFLNKMDKFLLEDDADGDDDEKTFTRTNKHFEYNRFIYYRIIIKFILSISFQIVN